MPGVPRHDARSLLVKPADLVPSGEPHDDVHQLLALAGANISNATLAAWSAAQRDDAVAWARAQLVAWQRDRKGYETSVFWPEHVSLAHTERATHDNGSRAGGSSSRTGSHRSRHDRAAAAGTHAAAARSRRERPRRRQGLRQDPRHR